LAGRSILPRDHIIEVVPIDHEIQAQPAGHGRQLGAYVRITPGVIELAKAFALRFEIKRIAGSSGIRGALAGNTWPSSSTIRMATMRCPSQAEWESLEVCCARAAGIAASRPANNASSFGLE